MKNQRIKILQKVSNGELTPEQADEQLLGLFVVGFWLPTKDEAVGEGYRIAKYEGYNYRRVLREPDHDIYYSGWMDCFDWISKGNELMNKGLGED